jgi:hypothetical protein
MTSWLKQRFTEEPTTQQTVLGLYRNDTHRQVYSVRGYVHGWVQNPGWATISTNHSRITYLWSAFGDSHLITRASHV